MYPMSSWFVYQPFYPNPWDSDQWFDSFPSEIHQNCFLKLDFENPPGLRKACFNLTKRLILESMRFFECVANTESLRVKSEVVDHDARALVWPLRSPWTAPLVSVEMTLKNGLTKAKQPETWNCMEFYEHLEISMGTEWCLAICSKFRGVLTILDLQNWVSLNNICHIGMMDGLGWWKIHENPIVR